MTTDMTVANEIRRQIGPGALMMIGAKNLAGDEASLSMRIGRNSKGINYMKVTLTPDDLYDVEYGYIRAMKYTVKATEEGIYNDMLHASIERNTGLYTSL